jgi:hypothetical protein
MLQNFPLILDGFDLLFFDGFDLFFDGFDQMLISYPDVAIPKKLRHKPRGTDGKFPQNFHKISELFPENCQKVSRKFQKIPLGSSENQPC